MSVFNIKSLLFSTLGNVSTHDGEVLLRKYIEDIIKLSKSLVLFDKREYEASFNSSLKDSSEQTYILHLKGQVPSTENPDLPSLIKDRLDYISIDEVYSEFPGKETLVTGVAHPVELEGPVENGTILYYDKSHVAKNELTLMEDLQDLIYNHIYRYDVPAYSIVDPGYYIGYRFILATDIVKMLISIREKYKHTNYASEFHIKQYLDSHNNVNSLYDDLTLENTLWFYRNMLALEKNRGNHYFNRELVKRMFIDNSLEIYDIDFKKLKFKDIPLYTHYRSDVLTGEFNSNVKHVELLSMTVPLANENDTVSYYDKRDLARRTVRDKQLGKFLRIEATSSYPLSVDPIQLRLSYWANLVDKAYTPNPTEVKYLFRGVEVKVSLKYDEALAYTHVLICQLRGGNYDNGVPNKVTAFRIHSDPDTNLYSTISDADLKYVNDNVVGLPADGTEPVGLKSYFDNIVSVEDNIYTRQTMYDTVQGYGEYQDMLNITHKNITDITLPFSRIVNQPYFRIPDDMDEKTKLLNTLLGTFTGYYSSEDIERYLKIKRLIEAYRKLSSYDTDILMDPAKEDPYIIDPNIPKSDGLHTPIITEQRACLPQMNTYSNINVAEILAFVPGTLGLIEVSKTIGVDIMPTTDTSVEAEHIIEACSEREASLY